MRYLDVCAGISASSVAWEPLGWECAGYSEIEPFPRAVLEQRHGAEPVDWDHRHREGSNIKPLFGDFTKIEAHHVGPIDLLVGGTPCQAFSVAGKRLGLDDPRGNLAIEFLALARRLRARWLVWENVPGVYSSQSGGPENDEDDEWEETADFLEFLNLFRECGFRGGWRTLDAQYVRVDGFERAVPQRRRRVFLVGYLGDAARPATVLFEPESLRGDPAPRREAGEGIAPTFAARSKGGGGLGTDFDCDGGLVTHEVAGAMVHQSHGGVDTQSAFSGNIVPVAHSLRAEGFDASEDGTGRGTPLVPVAFSCKDYGNDALDNLSPTLRSMRHDGSHANGGGQVAVAIQAGALRENPSSGPDGIGVQNDLAYTIEARSEVQAVAFDAAQITSPTNRGRISPNDPAPTLQVGSRMHVAQSWAVRRLTPRECERLQGFPDDFTEIEWRGKPAADGPRYKALGNSMAVNVMRWIGRRIDLVERLAP